MDERRPLVIAHRGFHRDAPENSLPSIRKAAEIGADMVELDVRCTSDGHPVVFHDHSLYRTTAQRGIIEMLTLKQVGKLDIGFNREDEFAGARIPTLDEALALAKKRILVNIEIKTPGAEEKVVRLIKKHGMERRVLVSSLRYSVVQKVRRLAPGVAAGFVAHYISDFGELKRELGLHSVILWAPLLLSKLPVDAAHDAGVRVIAWPVNSVRLFKVLTRLGVDGVITGIPDRIVQSLSEKASRRIKALPPPLEGKE